MNHASTALNTGHMVPSKKTVGHSRTVQERTDGLDRTLKFNTLEPEPESYLKSRYEIRYLLAGATVDFSNICILMTTLPRSDHVYRYCCLYVLPITGVLLW